MRFWEKPKKEIVIPLDYDENGNEIARMRIRLFIKRGKLENYVVQLEYNVRKLLNRWKNIVRYNFYHGFAHKDLLKSNGRYIKEEIGRFEDLSKVVVIAIKDIKDNFEKYIREYESG